ncbi:MAPEG family protein [Robiginitomaculum antarcticum]|uniref:MAPEG family protein n=1 Tax=Robiginitomaculum antarcticum TaxID=437507 RepID=UPI00036D7D56|nr:MAPEG family protein [Robiginitomaculum antarcticum]
MDNTLDIFKPVFVQAIMMMLIACWLVWARVGSAVRGKVDMRDVVKNGWPRGWIKNSGDNFDNQYQVPLLFIAVCIIAFVTAQADHNLVLLAWAFVALRIVHAAIHLTFNHILMRFSAFLASTLILFAMIIKLALAVF